MSVLKSTYNKLKKELEASVRELREEKNTTHNKEVRIKARINDALEEIQDTLDGTKDSIEVIFEELLSDLKNDDPTLSPTIEEDVHEGLKKLEEKLATIPDGARGNGGVDVIKNGKKETLNFSTKKEALDILEDAKKGLLTIVADQPW